jgi:hypothetical protein
MDCGHFGFCLAQCQLAAHPQKMKHAVMGAAATILMGCSAPDQISFCNAAGAKLENVFFHTKTGSMAFDDVISRSLECDGSDLCFDEDKETFVVNSSARPVISKSIEYHWGIDTWILDRKTSKLSYETQNSIVTSCSSVPISDAR